MVIGLLALLGNVQQTELKPEEAMRIGRAFVAKYCEKDLKLISVQPYIINDRPADGTDLKFVSPTEREYRLKLSRAGEVESLWLEGNSPFTSINGGLDWHKKVTKRGLKFIREMGEKRPVGTPQYNDHIQKQWSLFYPLLVNEKRFVGSSPGYSIELGGPDYVLTRYSRSILIPKVNAEKAAVTSEQALEEAKRNYPSDPDFDTKSGTKRYQFKNPTLVYYCEDARKEPGILAWFFWMDDDQNTGHARQGRSVGIVVDATTGKLIRTKNTLSPFL